MSQYSVAEAKDRFSKLIREAESGDSVQITRRGKPVAYLIGVEHVPSGANRPIGFMERLTAFKQKHAPNGIDFDPDEFLQGIRSKDPGRDFSW